MRTANSIARVKIAFGLFAITALAGAAVRGAEPAAESEPPKHSIAIEGAAGFSRESGLTLPNVFVPVHIALSTKGEPATGEVVVRSLKPARETYDPRLVFPFEVGLNSSKRFHDIFQVLPTDESLVAEVFIDGEKIAETHIPLSLIPPANAVVLALTQEAGRLDSFASASHTLPSERRTLVYGEAAYLPQHYRGYEGIDAVIVDGASLVDLRPEHVSALATWLQSGGTLVVATGSEWQRVQASPLAELLPVEMKNTMEIPSPFGAAGSMLVARMAIRGEAKEDAVVFWEAPESTRPNSRTTPLIVSRRMGEGMVHALAFRLQDETVAKFAQFDEMRDRLLPRRRSGFSKTAAGVGREGLESALQRTALMPVPGPAVIARCFILYLALGLPGVFLLVRLFKGNGWAWAMAPLAIAGATIGALAYMKREAGNQRAFTQLSFLELTPRADVAEAFVFSMLYTPVEDRFDIVSHRDDDLFLPIQAASIAAKRRDLLPFWYATQPQPMLRGLEAPARQSSSFQATGVRTLGGGDANPGGVFLSRRSAQKAGAEFEWETQDEWLTGEVVNATGSTLHDAAFLGMGRAQSLGDLPPGKRVPVHLRADSGSAIRNWAATARPRAGTTADWNAHEQLLTAGRQALASFPATGEAYLAGWLDSTPAAFTAYSLGGYRPLTAEGAIDATWAVEPFALRAAVGSLHLEPPDFDARGWNSQARAFRWDEREDFYASLDLPEFLDEWTIEFRPRVRFERQNAASAQSAIGAAWGSLRDNWDDLARQWEAASTSPPPGQRWAVREESAADELEASRPTPAPTAAGPLDRNRHIMEIYDFAAKAWVAPPPATEGRRFFNPREGANDRRGAAIPAGQRFVDPQTGAFWVRIKGNPFILRDAKFSLQMNYEVVP